MTPIEAALVGVQHDLDDIGTPWALVGGFAVSARVEPRFTRDVDVAVAVTSDADAELLVHGLASRGYLVTTTIDHEPSGRLATVRLEAPGAAPVVVDLLFASSGIEPEVVDRAERIELLPGLVLPVAGISALIVMKVLARDDATRPQDAADLVQLTHAASVADWAEARELAGLVERRGFNRGRDLMADVNALSDEAHT